MSLSNDSKSGSAGESDIIDDDPQIADYMISQVSEPVDNEIHSPDVSEPVIQIPAHEPPTVQDMFGQLSFLYKQMIDLDSKVEHLVTTDLLEA